jgi:quercetin dioxygenase-like cupin family protein
MTPTIRDCKRPETAPGAAATIDRRTHLAWPGLAVVGGLLLVTAAAILLPEAGPSMARTARVWEPSIAALPTVSTSTNTYIPGHSSGWHVHSGLHSVVVLSGTLTVYDENCVRIEYGPGQTYLGGSTRHVARNEGLDDVDVATTYVHRSATQDHGRTVSPPAGCELQ